MTKAINIESIEKATGKSWEEWLKFFESIGAKDMSHTEIAQAVMGAGTPGWWAQSVTVAYEQHIGRRVPGQREDGTFEVSVTKTLDGNLDEAMEWWLDKVSNATEFNSVAVDGEPSMSKTDKWRHWRANLADGTKVIVSTSAKDTNKALLAVTNQKLASTDEVENWRTYWKQFLND